MSLPGVEPGRHETLAVDSQEGDLHMRLRADVPPPMVRGPYPRPQAEGGIEEVPFPGICGECVL